MPMYECMDVSFVLERKKSEVVDEKMDATDKAIMRVEDSNDISMTQKEVSRCESCLNHVYDYTKDERDFDQCYGIPGIRTSYCRCCYSDVSKTFLPEDAQEQRLECFVNQPHYWGVQDVNSLGSLFSKSRGELFLWEFVSQNEDHRNKLIQCVTNLRNFRIGFGHLCISPAHIQTDHLIPLIIDRSTLYIYRKKFGF